MNIISTKDIKCPICNGVLNSYNLIEYTSHGTYLLCECWSGDLNIESQHHLFIYKAKLPFIDETDKQKTFEERQAIKSLLEEDSKFCEDKS